MVQKWNWELLVIDVQADNEIRKAHLKKEVTKDIYMLDDVLYIFLVYECLPSLEYMCVLHGWELKTKIGPILLWGKWSSFFL